MIFLAGPASAARLPPSRLTVLESASQARFVVDGHALLALAISASEAAHRESTLCRLRRHGLARIILAATWPCIAAVAPPAMHPGTGAAEARWLAATTKLGKTLATSISMTIRSAKTALSRGSSIGGPRRFTTRSRFATAEPDLIRPTFAPFANPVTVSGRRAASSLMKRVAKEFLHA